MTVVMRLDADLTFDVDVPRDGTRPGAQLHGTVRAAGNQVSIQSDDIWTLAGRPGRAGVRQVADELHHLGLAVEVSGPRDVIVTIGAVRSPVLQRLVTRSRHVRLGSWIGALKAVTARRGSLLPPGTPWPPLPTVGGLPRTVTTTHASVGGGGHPRLYLSDTSDPASSRPVGVVQLPVDGVTIGSGDGVGLRLAGTDELQAEIIRTSDDEYVLIARSRRVPSTVGGRQLDRQILRTGSRIQLGTWRMSYVRDEFADHGRPYGGRIGGELGRQRTQPLPANRTRPSF